MHVFVSCPGGAAFIPHNFPFHISTPTIRHLAGFATGIVSTKCTIMQPQCPGIDHVSHLSCFDEHDVLASNQWKVYTSYARLGKWVRRIFFSQPLLQIIAGVKQKYCVPLTVPCSWVTSVADVVLSPVGAPVSSPLKPTLTARFRRIIQSKTLKKSYRSFICGDFEPALEYASTTGEILQQKATARSRRSVHRSFNPSEREFAADRTAVSAGASECLRSQLTKCNTARSKLQKRSVRRLR